jgi:hypothetical protein
VVGAVSDDDYCGYEVYDKVPEQATVTWRH